jgi:hypothetical protein
MIRISPFVTLLVAASLLPALAPAAELLRVTPVAEPTLRALPADARPLPAAAHRAPIARPSSRRAAPLSSRPIAADSVQLLVDQYVGDGWESSIALNPADGSNASVAYREGWDFDPDIPIGNLRTGTATWVSRAFPDGATIYGGFPEQPWMVAGNAPGEFLTAMIRQDNFPSDNTHVILARSIDNGLTFTKRWEILRDTKQDRPMFDVDRPQSLGGTSGTWDGKMYLCWDDWGTSGSGYLASYFDVLSNDTLVSENALSTPGSQFKGAKFQPVAGLQDGQVFLVSNSIANNGATVLATFHEITNGGATRTLGKSTLSWAPAGQRLGASTFWGVNGHRIDERGTLALDRTFGPRRGYWYFVSNRNPNPANSTQDQGDLYLSISVTRGQSWLVTSKIPTQFGKTQFYPMLDVDSQGWLHLAYYQNESGIQDAGVLNAGTVAVYYTVSRDGGQTWLPAARVNQPDHALNMEEPPLQLASYDYDLLGDYMQIRAWGNGDATYAYVAWTQYDQYRGDDALGAKKQRLYVTRMGTPQAPAASPGALAAIAAAMAAAGAVAVARRRRGRP